jgi:SpoVK/Ycf46/Vps4 family AAA+-type ATPase
MSKYLKNKGHQLFYIDFEEITADTNHRLKDVLDYLELIFQSDPGIIFMDNIDSICKVVTKDLHRQAEMIASRVLTRNLIEFIELYAHESCILVAQNHENLDEEIKQLETTHILLKNPSTESRRKYFEQLVGELNAAELLSNTESMSFSQILAIVLNE